MRERESSDILSTLDEVVRREREREVRYVLEFGGSGREKRGKKEKKKRGKVLVWRTKKREKKIERKEEIVWMKKKIRKKKLRIRN